MTWLIALAVSYIGLAVATLWSYWLAPAGNATDYWQAVVYTLAPAVAVAGGMFTVKEYGLRSSAGRIFFTITLGLGFWLIGEVLWTYFDLVTKTDPFPSLADWFYFIAYIPLGAGLVWQYLFLLQTVHTKLPYTQKLLLTMVAVLFSGIALYFGVYESIQTDYSLFENVVAIGYGVADIILVLLGLVITIVTIEMRGGKFSSAWGWFLFGILCTFIADIGFAMYSPEYGGGIGYFRPALDTIWIFGYMTIGYGLGRFGWLVHRLRARVRAENQTPSKVDKT